MGETATRMRERLDDVRHSDAAGVVGEVVGGIGMVATATGTAAVGAAGRLAAATKIKVGNALTAARYWRVELSPDDARIAARAQKSVDTLYRVDRRRAKPYQDRINAALRTKLNVGGELVDLPDQIVRDAATAGLPYR